MSPRSKRKSALGQRSTSKNTSMSYKPEPVKCSCDGGQRIPCFDGCQLIITWMLNIREVYSKPRLNVSDKLLIWIIAAMLRDSVVVVRTRPWAIPLAMINMRISTHGFPIASHMGMAPLKPNQSWLPCTRFPGFCVSSIYLLWVLMCWYVY